ncbi:MAG: hypothetical protein ACRDPA_25220 [Solirubrobacteraceae bacterium]
MTPVARSGQAPAPTSARRAATQRPQSGARRASPLGAYGERPPSPFGGLPVAEIAIFVGAVVLVVGVINRGTAALIGGVVICLFGVLEVTTREHFSGYRSHTVLLAAIPAVAVEFVIALTVGPPAVRALLLVPVAAVFATCAWFLRKRFLVARQARIAKPAKTGPAAT